VKKFLALLVFLALGVIVWSFFWPLSAAAAGDDFPYGNGVNVSVSGLTANTATVSFVTPPSSASYTYVYGFVAENNPLLWCGQNVAYWNPQSTVYVPTYARCLGRTLKWHPTGGATYRAMLVYSSVSYQSPYLTSVTNDFDPVTNVDVVASNSFSPVSNITSSGSFTIGSASFSLDTSGLDSEISSYSDTFRVSVLVIIFFLCFFGVVRNLRKS